jgi:hypothetical protein
MLIGGPPCASYKQVSYTLRVFNPGFYPCRPDHILIFVKVRESVGWGQGLDTASVFFKKSISINVSPH